YEIPEQKILAVKERVRMELAHRLHLKAGSANAKKETREIKIWSGYAGPSQEGMLTKIYKKSQKDVFKIGFDRVKELIEFACKNKDKKNSITILPYNLLSGEDRKRLNQSNARVIYMDLEEQELAADEIIQLQAIIAAGAAYLNEDELSFSNLYKILIDEDKDLGISVKELIQNPALAVNYIFKIKVNKVEIDDIKYLNRRMEELLTFA
ncbi:MAG: hypothetical protein ABH869_07980, partial [Candidatus Omnitrophota bacterium]